MKALKKLTLKAGVEIHQQLDTKNKLFCDCLARLSQDEPVRREIRKLRAQTDEKGLTIVPLKIYFKGKVCKLELGVARGKKLYDKRQAIKKRDEDRRIRRISRKHER